MTIRFNFDNSYAEQLEGFYTACIGDVAPSPKLLKFNQPLADELGLGLGRALDGLPTDEIAAIFSGGTSLQGAMPLAQVYAGHQFGGFSPQLGDGRALLLGEVIDCHGARQDIHLKGSGRTAYSRGGDGKAALGPVLREYIMGEAMHALNVPTTRALAAVLTGETIMRDRPLPGAVLTRTASSHLRVGTFQFFAARGESDKVKQLADYTIQRHFPELKNSATPYLDLISAVRDRQAALVARWMLLGFVHGVMNTDNMTISGETIDYGPCAFIDHYDPAAVFSSIDKQGRYAYGNQPSMAQWNLARLAETLLPLIDPNSEQAINLATHEINTFNECYQGQWLVGMRTKLGLSTEEEGDLTLAQDLHQAMEAEHVDFTQLFRGLAGATQDNTDAVEGLFDNPERFNQWQLRWRERLSRDPMQTAARITSMNAVNPIYIPRNHKVEEALQAAERDADYAPFEKLMAVLANPFEPREGLDDYAAPAPVEFGPYKTFCGT